MWRVRPMEVPPRQSSTTTTSDNGSGKLIGDDGCGGIDAGLVSLHQRNKINNSVTTPRIHSPSSKIDCSMSMTATTLKDDMFNTANNNGNDGENSSTSLSSSIPSNTKSTSERVLRYGETIDSLFCLLGKKEDGHEYHRDLCQEICLGCRGDDAHAWVEALELSLERAARAVSADGDEGKKEAYDDLSDVGKKKYCQEDVYPIIFSLPFLHVSIDVSHTHLFLLIFLLSSLFSLNFYQQDND